jgi:hypothetical protein
MHMTVDELKDISTKLVMSLKTVEDQKKFLNEKLANVVNKLSQSKILIAELEVKEKTMKHCTRTQKSRLTTKFSRHVTTFSWNGHKSSSLRSIRKLRKFLC